MCVCRLVTCLQVAKFVGLQYGTFFKHYKNTITPTFKKKSLGTGPRSFLGEPLEDEIVKHIDNLWVRGFPLTWWSVKQIARDIAKANNIDGFMASNGWCKRLKARYPILGSRVAQGFERTRVGALNPEQTQKYMELVREAINKVEELNGGVKFTPDLLLNLDETGFDPVNNQDIEVICLKTRRGATYTVTSSDRTHCSAAVCITAAGVRFATMYALKGTRRLYRNLPNCPEGTAYVMTEKGYFGDEAFEKYIKFLVAQIPKDGRWRLLVLDGYGSHTMVPSVLDFLVANKIHAICMPSHSSEFLQPLDISCFSPTKGEFRKDLREILLQFSIGAVTRWHLPAIFELALQFGCTEGNIKGGFQACGHLILTGFLRILKSLKYLRTWMHWKNAQKASFLIQFIAHLCRWHRKLQNCMQKLFKTSNCQDLMKQPVQVSLSLKRIFRKNTYLFRSASPTYFQSQ